MEEQGAPGGQPTVQAQPVLNYPVGLQQFQMMQGLLQAAQMGASTTHAEQLDGLKAAITGTAGAQPEPKRQKVDAGDGEGSANEAALYQAAIDTLGANAPVQLLGLPTHPIITSLALPIGGQLQLNGLQLQGHEGDDSGEDGTQDDGEKGHDDRAHATKEKNRKAQQRFRARQKEKMQRLEHEVEILRKQLADKGPDTSVALRVDPGPSVDEMYEQLEQMLDQVPGLDSLPAITFLQAWLNKLPDETRRLNYKAIKKRFDEGKKEEVKMWITKALEPA